MPEQDDNAKVKQYGTRQNIYLPTGFTRDDWKDLVDAAAAVLQDRKVELRSANRRLAYSDSDVVIKALQYLTGQIEGEV